MIHVHATFMLSILVTKETDRVRGKVTLERQQYKYHPEYNNHSSEMYMQRAQQQFYGECELF